MRYLVQPCGSGEGWVFRMIISIALVGAPNPWDDKPPQTKIKKSPHSAIHRKPANAVHRAGVAFVGSSAQQ